MDQANLNKLRQQIAKMEGRPAAQILSNNQIDHFHKADTNYNHQSLNNVEFTHFCLGLSEADEIIKPILRGSLHEIVPAPSHWQAAYGFVLALILRANKSPSLQPLIWIEDDGILFEYGGLNPYGIIAMGLDPSQLILIRCAHLTDVLKAGDDALQLKNISGVVLSLSDSCKALDFTTSRRLHLASEKNNIPAFMLMAKNAPKTSSAFTRWRIASGQSISSGAMAPGAPFLMLNLFVTAQAALAIGLWNGTFMTKPLVNRLYLALYFPYLPTNRIMRSRQKNTPVKNENNALALISRQASGLVITAINRQAAAKGLYIGQSMSEAKAIFPEFEVQMSEPHKDNACLKWLAEAAERFTPLIAYNLPFGLMLDITGCDHLFGGAKNMLDRVIEFYQNLGFETKAAITTTPQAARIFARFGKGGIVEQQNLAPTLDIMSLKALELEEAIYHGLTKAGFKTIGAIRNLKPAALNARFGAVPVTKLQLLYGQKHHPISPITPKPLCYKIGRLNDPVMNEDQMIVVLEPLAQDFCKKLRDRGEGAKLIHIAFFRVDGARQIIAIETSKPLNEAVQLMRLIKERLTSLATPLDIGYGFDAFAFAALECEKIIAVEQNLFVKSQDNSEITSFIDRLSTRLGHDRVLRLELHQSHIPEKAFAWQPALYAGKVKTDHFEEAMFFAQNQEAAERPCRIFVPPQPIDVVAAVPDSPPASFRWRRVLHRIRLAEGPERIGAEWWKNSAPTRDYYRVEDEIGRRFWIFRYGLYSEKSSPKWFLHGLFA